jgi:hypothetical protein
MIECAEACKKDVLVRILFLQMDPNPLHEKHDSYNYGGAFTNLCRLL